MKPEEVTQQAPGAGELSAGLPRGAVTSSGSLIGAILAAAALLWLFIWLADEVMEHATQRFDAGIVDYLQAHLPQSLHHLMLGLTWLGSGPIQALVTLAAALYFISRRRLWPDGAAVLIAGYGEIALDEGLKRLFHRFRPEPVFYHLGYSFPSGHAMAAVVVYGMIAYEAARHTQPRFRLIIWAIAVLMMLLVGFSRVALAQHYPTDVLGGYLAGVCWLWGCISWASYVERRITARQRIARQQ